MPYSCYSGWVVMRVRFYPDETVDSGRTATVSLSFTGLKAWPKENMLSLCAFGEDKSKPLQTQRISKPAEDGKRLKLRLNNVTPDTRSIEVAVISMGIAVGLLLLYVSGG